MSSTTLATFQKHTIACYLGEIPRYTRVLRESWYHKLFKSKFYMGSFLCPRAAKACLCTFKDSLVAILGLLGSYGNFCSTKYSWIFM